MSFHTALKMIILVIFRYIASAAINCEGSVAVNRSMILEPFGTDSITFWAIKLPSDAFILPYINFDTIR